MKLGFSPGDCKNGQRNRHSSSENPMFIHEEPWHDIKFDVWCAISAARFIDHIFIPRPQIRVDILHTFCHHFPNARSITREIMYLLSKQVNNYLSCLQNVVCDTTRNKLFVVSCAISEAMCFCLWEVSKEEVYGNACHSEDDVKIRIWDSFLNFINTLST
jgi:hypothetical protein